MKNDNYFAKFTGKNKKRGMFLLFTFFFSIVKKRYLYFLVNSILAIAIALINFNIGVVIKDSFFEMEGGVDGNKNSKIKENDERRLKTIFDMKYKFEPVFFGIKPYQKAQLSLNSFIFHMLFFIIFFKSFFSFIHRLLMNHSYELIEKDLKKELFYTFVDSKYYKGVDVSKILISHFSSDLDTLVDHVWFIPNRLIYLLVTIFHHFKYDFGFGKEGGGINWKFTKIVLTLFFFLSVIEIFSLRKITDIGVKIRKNLEKDNRAIYERISNFEYIKLVSGEENEKEKMSKQLDSTFDINKSHILLSTILKVIPNYLLIPNNPFFFISLVIIFARESNRKNNIYLFFNFSRYYFTVQKLNSDVGKILDALIDLEQLSSNLLVLAETVDKLNKQESISVPCSSIKEWSDGDVRFDDVVFAYPHRHDQDILRNFSFVFEKGKSYGIAGKNGIGKSTIAKNIMRLYELKSGSIHIGDINIDLINVPSLHKRVCYQTNRPGFFSMSIADNVFYPEKYSKERIVDLIVAAEKVGIIDFINNLPNSFDTVLEEKGQNLSEGQKQQISAMKIFVHDYDILILDEILSNVHPVLRKKILENIFLKISNKTVIVIDHHYEIFKYVDYTYNFTGESLLKVEKKDLLKSSKE